MACKTKLLHKIGGEILLQLDLKDDPHGIIKNAALVYANQAVAVDPKTSKEIRDYYDAIEKAQKPLPALCEGYRGKGQWKCCERAGEYNGFGSDGPLAFICPNRCGCHD